MTATAATTPVLCPAEWERERARRDDAVPSWAQAAAWALGLSLLFLLVYGGSNLFAAAHGRGPGFYFAWERRLPVVPAMVIPYWSIDFLFLGSFFLCTTRRELRVHGARFGMAILTAGLLFVLFPFRFGFDRPSVQGFFGPLFRLLHGMDAPYNLAPSLHIADLAILWPVYVRHTRGALRSFVRAWLVLIGFSTLLTWQHHLIDLVTGQFLGMACLYALPYPRLEASQAFRPTGLALQQGRRLAAGYAAIALLFSVLAVRWQSWWWALLWPAVSFGIVALGYAKLGPTVFRKSRGRLPFSARWMLAPYLLCAWLSWRSFRRRTAPWARVAPGVVIGRRLTGREATALIRGERVTAVLDLTAEFSEVGALRQLDYFNVPVLDLTTPTDEQLDAAVAFLREHAGRGGTVFIHCALGLGRAACVVTAYLLSEKLAPSAEAAAECVRSVRPRIVCRDDSLGAIRAFCGE